MLSARVKIGLIYFLCMRLHFPFWNVVNLLQLYQFHLFYIVQDGLTALHKAALCGRESMIRYLLKAGADIMAADNVSCYFVW